jgi:tRNA(Arg) A34 adenosine deaminase TadA
MTEAQKSFMQLAIDLSREGMINGKGGPFGCVIVKDGTIVGKGCNSVCSTNDPTAHAEIVAIREACNNMNTYQLQGCEVYTSCEPCPMCMGAIYWARPDRVFFANDKNDAAEAGFDDNFIYEELTVPLPVRKIPMKQLFLGDAKEVFRQWMAKADKMQY